MNIDEIKDKAIARFSENMPDDGFGNLTLTLVKVSAEVTAFMLQEYQKQQDSQQSSE